MVWNRINDPEDREWWILVGENGMIEKRRFHKMDEILDMVGEDEMKIEPPTDLDDYYWSNFAHYCNPISTCFMSSKSWKHGFWWGKME